MPRRVQDQHPDEDFMQTTRCPVTSCIQPKLSGLQEALVQWQPASAWGHGARLKSRPCFGWTPIEPVCPPWRCWTPCLNTSYWSSMALHWKQNERQSAKASEIPD
ncbi:hypothetical protein TGAM01_v209639 [Trichoderma gamsii]|uniref:Uncharacterized protein n=1 Tax=Trichoderma gamsii TaxID=398673 RepID=A0A2P4ZB42_9HYPO|nr:hypothetical protein TGAM01_v209639 [Trichoderma gamsii]PON21476.1 hypothetical protein TGAM01_v209639 [Trichoderma gamsii]